MILPVTFAEWCWLAVKILLAVAPPSLLIWLWRELTAHSLSLHVQRVTKSDSSKSEYLIAVQNNEDVPLGEHRLTITILDDGEFVGEPEVYAGCNRFERTKDSSRVWRLDWDVLPAYDLWSITCQTTSAARNITVEVDEGHSRLTGNSLFLRGDYTSAFTGGHTRTWLWWVLTFALGTLCYLGAVWVWSGTLAINDAWYVAWFLIFALGACVGSRYLTPRGGPSIAQGYWDPSKGTD